MRLRRPIIFALALFTVVVASNTAEASSVGRSKKLGLGIMLGAPSGFSLKYYLGQKSAVDFGAGIGWLGGSGVHIHADYLWHFMLARPAHFDLPLYVGVGPKLAIWFKDGRRYWGHKKGDGRVGLGVRVPIGLAFNLHKAPVDIFVEAVPGLGILPGIGMFVDGSVGVRYYF